MAWRLPRGASPVAHARGHGRVEISAHPLLETIRRALSQPSKRPLPHGRACVPCAPASGAAAEQAPCKRENRSVLSPQLPLAGRWTALLLWPTIVAVHARGNA
jgi:hypothetical protein